MAFYAWELMAISAIVQFGLALPMAMYFHRLSITGLTANLLVVPLMSAVVPVGFVAVFTGWRFTAAIAGWLLDLAGAVAQWHVRWEPEWRIPDPPAWLALLFALALLAGIYSPPPRRGTAQDIAIAFPLCVSASRQ